MSWSFSSGFLLLMAPQQIWNLSCSPMHSVWLWLVWLQGLVSFFCTRAPSSPGPTDGEVHPVPAAQSLHLYLTSLCACFYFTIKFWWLYLCNIVLYQRLSCFQSCTFVSRKDTWYNFSFLKFIQNCMVTHSKAVSCRIFRVLRRGTYILQLLGGMLCTHLLAI